MRTITNSLGGMLGSYTPFLKLLYINIHMYCKCTLLISPINTRQLNTEQTLDANCILYLNTSFFPLLLFFQKNANCNSFFNDHLILLKWVKTNTSHSQNQNKHHKHMFTCLFPFPKIIIISFPQTIQNKYFKHMPITINTSNIFIPIQ